jgi:hypothetical protein
VTQRRTGAVSSKAYSPDQQLIERCATKYAWKKEVVVTVLSEFGPLPEAGQEQLITWLVHGYGRYQYRAMVVTFTPSKQRDHLNAIEKTATTLLGRLADSSVKFWLATDGLVTAGSDAVAISAEFREAKSRVADFVHALTDLRDRAKTGAGEASKRIAFGHGGSRRRPGANSKLIGDAIAVYLKMRIQYPDSGKKPAFGGPMMKIRSCSR